MRTKIIILCLVGAVLLGGVAYAKSFRVSGAIVHIRQGEFEPAITLLEEEVAAAPDNAEAWAWLGEAYASVGRFLEAADAWDRAADLYAQKNKKKEVAKIDQSRMFFWDKALKAGQTPFARGLNFGKEGFTPEPGETAEADLDKAAAAFVATYRIFSAHPKTLLYLGMVYEESARVYAGHPADQELTVSDYDLETGAAAERQVKAGDYVNDLNGKAMVTYEKAIDLKRADMEGPKWDKQPLADYIIKAANILLHLKEYERALSMLDPLLAENPNDLMLLNAKAVVLENLGRLDEAIATYKRVSEQEMPAKDKAEVFFRLGSFYLNKDYAGRDPKQAITYLEEGEKNAPEDYRIVGLLGAAYNEIGEKDKAKDYLSRVEELYEKWKANGGK